QVDGALPLDEPDHLRYRILRWNRHQHVHMVRHQVAFFHLALLLRGQSPKHLSKVPTKLTVQRPATTLRDEHDVVFALPPRVAQTLRLVHRGSPFRVLGGSRLEVSTMDNPLNVKLLLPPRQSRGDSLRRARWAAARQRREAL